ncbi:hypothetical protein NDU88_000668 [Pleurodeles waltl]|uniref:Uncharacterized protein n=1 Tax=Pleurodeles waltl TaxID=8319 RepID=A0AAV7S8G2_PLEWA|nr:hypothetical protein NDU88_000668 [Pleurodeles waltl]
MREAKHQSAAVWRTVVRARAAGKDVVVSSPSLDCTTTGVRECGPTTYGSDTTHDQEHQTESLEIGQKGERAPRIFASLKQNPAACPGRWRVPRCKRRQKSCKTPSPGPASPATRKKSSRRAAATRYLPLPPWGNTRSSARVRPTPPATRKEKRPACCRDQVPACSLPLWKHALLSASAANTHQHALPKRERGRHQEGAPPQQRGRKRQPVCGHDKGTRPRLLPARKRAAQRKCDRRSKNTRCSSTSAVQHQGKCPTPPGATQRKKKNTHTPGFPRLCPAGGKKQKKNCKDIARPQQPAIKKKKRESISIHTNKKKK